MIREADEAKKVQTMTPAEVIGLVNAKLEEAQEELKTLPLDALIVLYADVGKELDARGYGGDENG